MAVVFLLATSALAQEGPNPFLTQAKLLFKNLEFEKCVARLELAPQWKSTPEELLEIELYAGLCLFNLGRPKDAEDRFQVALQIDYHAQLPPYTSPKIVEMFRRVRRRVPKPDLAKTADAPLKPEEPTLVPQDIPPEVVASPPSKRRVAPIAFGSVAVAGVGAGVLLGLRAQTFEQLANAAHFESDGVVLSDRARAYATWANVAYGVALTAAAATVLTLVFE